MTHGDITFYLSTIGSVLMLFGILWRVTVGATLKRMQDDAVTKLDLTTRLSELKDFLRGEFVSRREFDAEDKYRTEESKRRDR